MAKDNFMILQATPAMLAEKAAWIIYKEGIEKLLKEQDQVVLAVPGGRSVAPIFRQLRTLPIAWERVYIFMVDERLVPVTDTHSNYRILFDELGDLVPVGQLFPFNPDSVNPEDAIDQYNRQLADVGGRFDIVLLSGGEDGHIASLFPEHDQLDAEGDMFTLVDNSPKPPPRRMSATLKLLHKTKLGILLFIGDEKQQPLNLFLDPSGSIRQCPARVVAEMPQYFVLTDREVRLP